MEKSVSRTYHVAVLGSLVATAMAWVTLRYGFSAPPGSMGLAALALLLVATPFAVRIASDREHGAARLLAYAATVLGISMGSANASGNGLYLFAGFILAIAYGVYALMKNVDDHVAPARILVLTLLQGAIAFYLASS